MFPSAVRVVLLYFVKVEQSESSPVVSFEHVSAEGATVEAPNAILHQSTMAFLLVIYFDYLYLSVSSFSL